MDMDDAAHGAKTLIHALLCGEGRCSRPDCMQEVQHMKSLLKKMEAHAEACTSVANHHSGKRRCEQCNKWLQLQKLRDRFTRQLLQAGSSRRGGGGGGRRAPKGGGPPSSGPPLLQRSVTMCVESVEEDESLDLSLLRQAGVHVHSQMLTNTFNMIVQG